MKKRILDILCLAVVSLFILARGAYALDYSTLCAGHIIKSEDMPIPAMLTDEFSSLNDAISVDSNGDGINDAKLLCFNGEPLFTSVDPFNDNLTINAPSGLSLFVYNLKIYFSSTSTMTIGSNVILNTLNILGSSTSPVTITGSNVQLIDSTITATQTGISISGGSDIVIEGTTITGPEPSATNSTGIQIAGAQEVSIDNGTLLKNLDTGVSGAANVMDADFDNVSAPINNASISAATTVDTSKAGKKLNSDGTKVTKIAGSDPVGSCNVDQAANGHVNLYLKTTYASSYSYQGNCPVKLLSGSDSVCIYHGAGVAPDNKDKCVEANDCTCYNAGACVFDCEDLNIGIDKVASFAYTDNLGNAYDLTTPINISDLGTWLATLAPAAPLDAGDLTGGDDGTATGDDGGSNLVGVEAGGEDGGGSITSIGIAKGCSLVPTKDSRLSFDLAQDTRGNDRLLGNDKRDIRWIATAFGLAMTMLSVPVVARVRAKKN